MRFYSQAGQDQWVVDTLGGMRHGYFVDVGAYDGVESSNTLTLEDELGWRGICIEANPDVYLRLVQQRWANCINVAVTDHSGYCRFAGDQIVEADGIAVPCDTLTHILDSQGAHLVIDYMSVDIEGAELDALSHMDFSRYYVRLLTAEHNLYRDGPALKEALAELLAPHFERVVEDVVAPGYGPCEDWWRNVTFSA